MSLSQIEWAVFLLVFWNSVPFDCATRKTSVGPPYVLSHRQYELWIEQADLLPASSNKAGVCWVCLAAWKAVMSMFSLNSVVSHAACGLCWPTCHRDVLDALGHCSKQNTRKRTAGTRRSLRHHCGGCRIPPPTVVSTLTNYPPVSSCEPSCLPCLRIMTEDGRRQRIGSANQKISYIYYAVYTIWI